MILITELMGKNYCGWCGGWGGGLKSGGVDPQKIQNNKTRECINAFAGSLIFVYAVLCLFDFTALDFAMFYCLYFF